MRPSSSGDYKKKILSINKESNNERQFHFNASVSNYEMRTCKNSTSALPPSQSTPEYCNENIVGTCEKTMIPERGVRKISEMHIASVCPLSGKEQKIVTVIGKFSHIQPLRTHCFDV